MAARKSKTVERESDLYGPVRDHLAALGYTVRGEVKGCDVAATRDEELVVVELKRNLSVDLLIQATQRQAAADAVYVAVPRPANMGRNGRWRGVKRLLKRLELGLIVVSFTRRKPVVQVVEHPIHAPRRKSRTKRGVIIREIAGRSGDYNPGGTRGKKILTAYRESALFIACCLDRFGALSPKELRALGASARTQRILYDDVYGWFDRLARAQYDIKPAAKKALGEYPGLVKEFRKQLKAAEPDRAA